MQLWALITDSLRESLDRRSFWVLLVLTLLITLVMLSIGFDGQRISFFFGLWTAESKHLTPVADLGRANLVGFMIYYVANTVVGWIGVTLMIIATAGVFPAFTERGAVDLALAKPISRPRLFLYKYLAGMTFVVLQGTIFFGLTFLVMWLRWGVFAPGYLLSIVFLVLLFSYVYCVSALVGVKTRSAVASILVSIFCWILFALVHQAPSVFDAFPDLKKRRLLYNGVTALSWIPPKTGDFPYLAAKFAQAGTSIDAFPFFDMFPMSEADRSELQRARKLEERELAKSWVPSVGSSLLFEAVIVLWAMWIFSRKDY